MRDSVQETGAFEGTSYTKLRRRSIIGLYIYPAAAHAQSGVKQSVLSVCRQNNIEIRPLRTVYGFKEHWNKRKTYLLPFLGAGFVHMALSREC